MPMLAGRCTCGTVAFDVPDAFAYALNCHCSQCRRTTGAAFKPFAGIPSDQLRLTKAPDSLAIVGDEHGDHDTRCPACHALIYSTVRNGAWHHIPMGVLTDTPRIRPTAHIFVASKAPWFTITDDLPQFDEYPQ